MQDENESVQVPYAITTNIYEGGVYCNKDWRW